MRTPQLGCVVAVMVGVVAGRCGESHGADPTRGAISDDDATPQREAGNEEPAVRPLTVNRTGPEPPPAIAPFDAEQARQHQEAWAKHLGLPLELTNSVGTKFVLIPPGEFLMGSSESLEEVAKTYPGSKPKWFRNEQPQHQVRITRPFYLGVYEVTVGQFRQFVEAEAYRTDAERDGQGGWSWTGKEFQQDPNYSWRKAGFPQTDQHPVVNVSWNDAVAFCQWLSDKESRTFRLPTEAEWEYACRAGTTTGWSCGNDPEGLARIANVADGSYAAEGFGNKIGKAIAARDGYAFTAPVGRYQLNPFGLGDVHGNVWEWCQDWYDAEYYAKSPSEDPPGPVTGSIRVLRGGGWFSPAAYCRSAFRSRVVPGHRSVNLGFRVAAVPPGH